MFEIFKSNKKKSVLIILTDEVSPATYTQILAVQGYTDVVRISFDWEVSNWGSREIEDVAVNKAKLRLIKEVKDITAKYRNDVVISVWNRAPRLKGMTDDIHDWLQFREININNKT